jgi:hypothetical protein
MCRKSHILTEEEKSDACKLYLVEKLSITEISNIYNASSARVKKALIESGIAIDSRGKRGNRYLIKGNAVHIELRRRNQESLWAIIDIDDLKKVVEFDYTWHAEWKKDINGYYASATKHLGIINGKQKSKSLYLHKFILNDDSKIDIDHINHNTLDNRKENLRMSKVFENSRYRKGKNSNNISGYRNVAYIKSIKKKPYHVQLMVDGKNTVLGKFSDVDKAGVFAEEMRQKFYGEFAGEG